MRTSAFACLLLLLGLAGCGTLTPEESCRAICADLAACQVAISGSSLAAGASCESDCLGKITARGAACKGSAANLGECFATYTCQGLDLCGAKAASFATDCQ